MNDNDLQSSEVELLQSMYTIDELQISSVAKHRILELHLTFGEHVINLDINLPTDYPSLARPLVYARCSSIIEQQLNPPIRKFIEELELGSPMLLELINWMTDKFKYDLVASSSSNKAASTMKEAKEVSLARLWIYSHHIYSSIKRRKILALASRLQLRGFCVPGKPGLIVVEGMETDCEEFYAKTRSWNWQKLQLRRKDISGAGGTAADFHRMPKFSEQLLSVSGDKSGENDLRHYLANLGFEDMFYDIFLS